MKNLRKVLAVVLVVCMAFSLMAVASAANLKDYADASTVAQKEAVDVMAATGVMTGDGGTSWNPTGTFTREQAAKVVATLLSPSAGKTTVTTSSFADVAATRWSSAYIEYCAARGIISGYGDGKFGPTDAVTGSQFSVMLLKALGYGKNNEFAANWEVYAIDQGILLGILTLDVNYSAAATREQVAQYALNALQLPFQAFSKDTSEYQNTATFASFATRLGIQTEVKTVNGVTGHVWEKTLGGADLTGLYSTDIVLGTSKNGQAIATLATSTSPFYIAALDNTVTATYTGVAYFYNGAELAKVADTGTVVAGAKYYNTTAGAIYTSADAVAGFAGDTAYVVPKGAIVNFISLDFDNKAEKVTIIEKAVATLTADPLVNVTTKNVTITAIAGCSNQLPANVPGYDALKAYDVVLWYKDVYGVFNIEKATAVTGTLSSYVDDTSITVAGTTYTYSALDSTVAYNDVEATFGLPNTTFYLDDGGYVVAATQAVAANTAANYLFVILEDGTINQVAKVVLSDGTTKVVTVDATGAPAAVNQFFKFTVTSTGTYVLTAVIDDAKAMAVETTTVNNTAYQNDYDGATVALTITKNKVAFLDNTTTPLATALHANTGTAFLYQGATSVAAYAGIAKVPNYSQITATPATEDVYVLYMNGTALMVYATGGQADGTTTTGDWVYVMNASPTVNYVNAYLTTYTYQAIVNGLAGTITTASPTALNAVDLYLVTGYDTAGYVTIANGAAATNTNYPALAADTLTAAGGTITANATNYFVVDDAVKYYYVDASLLAYGVVTSYELTATQVTALTSTGDVVDFVAKSTTDSTVIAVYIYHV